MFSSAICVCVRGSGGEGVVSAFINPVPREAIMRLTCTDDNFFVFLHALLPHLATYDLENGILRAVVLQ